MSDVQTGNAAKKIKLTDAPSGMEASHCQFFVLVNI